MKKAFKKPTDIMNFLREIFIKCYNFIIKLSWREITTAAILAILAGFIIFPSAYKSAQNGQKNKCSSRMYLMLSHLSEHLLEEDGIEWQNMALENDGEAIAKLAEEVIEKDGWKINKNDYYFELSGKDLILRCKKHKDITDRKILLSNLDETEELDLKNLGWNVNASREIKNIQLLGDDAMIINAGISGKYCLAAWKWEDYVEEAKNAEEDDKVFGASIILYDGAYYYYPDGFRIRKNALNTHPFKYAEDLENRREGAYCIPFDTASVSVGRFSQNNHDGSIMIEDEEIFIWQSQPSRELGKGWIKVYCEYKKL